MACAAFNYELSASAAGYVRDYIAADATHNNPSELGHIATMSINPGETGFNVQGQALANWQKVKSLTTTIWGLAYSPGNGRKIIPITKVCRKTGCVKRPIVPTRLY